MGGDDPYSSSKSCSELVANAYKKSFFKYCDIALASVRAGNVIGGGDWAKDRLVPDILFAFEKSIPALIRNPNSVRPWQHVLDPLAGYLILAERLYNDGQTFAEGWNFGPNDQDVRSVEWIAEYLKKLWGGPAAWTTVPREEVQKNLHESKYLKLDISKAKTNLGWNPCWNLESGLLKVVEWHLNWWKKNDAKAMCLQQILEHQNTAHSLLRNKN